MRLHFLNKNFNNVCKKCFFRLCIAAVVGLKYIIQRLISESNNKEQDIPKRSSFLWSLAKLSLILGYIYICDRTEIFQKQEKYVKKAE